MTFIYLRRKFNYPLLIYKRKCFKHMKNLRKFLDFIKEELRIDKMNEGMPKLAAGLSKATMLDAPRVATRTGVAINRAQCCSGSEDWDRISVGNNKVFD